MDNPETLATMSTRHRTKTNKQTQRNLYSKHGYLISPVV
jgi:hypothetical protein